MLRGQIWWGRVPMTGSRAKERPMLIVSDDAFNRNENYPKVMVVHITTVQRLGGPYSWEVALPRGTAGLERHSIAKCGEIYTVWKEHLHGPPGMIPRSFLGQIDRALAVALSLPLPA